MGPTEEGCPSLTYTNGGYLGHISMVLTFPESMGEGIRYKP